MKNPNQIIAIQNRKSILTTVFLSGAMSVLLLTACTKDNTVAEKSLDQQKVEFQQRQLEIEQQKLSIEKERMVYETQKKADILHNLKMNWIQNSDIRFHTALIHPTIVHQRFQKCNIFL